MRNLRMQERIISGEAVDISQCEKTSEGYYILKHFKEDVDYCDAKQEVWIWSIGQDLETGRFLAATTNIFYQNPNYRCVWLR